MTSRLEWETRQEEERLFSSFVRSCNWAASRFDFRWSRIESNPRDSSLLDSIVARPRNWSTVLFHSRMLCIESRQRLAVARRVSWEYSRCRLSRSVKEERFVYYIFLRIIIRGFIYGRINRHTLHLGFSLTSFPLIVHVISIGFPHCTRAQKQAMSPFDATTDIGVFVNCGANFAVPL